MSSDEGKSSSVVQNTSIASSPVEPKTLSVMNARLSICLYTASLSAGVRPRKSTLYFFMPLPPFRLIGFGGDAVIDILKHLPFAAIGVEAQQGGYKP